MNRVLFLCSGNYYRSRFAEIVFNWHAKARGLSWRAESRGLAIDSRNPGPISCHTIASLRERGIVLLASDRYPLAVSDADFAAARHVIAVKEGEHRTLLDSQFPRWSHLVEYWHVDDIDCAPPEQAIPQLEAHVTDLLIRLAALAPCEKSSQITRC